MTKSIRERKCEFTVEKDIPPPPSTIVYPFKTMEVGESFLQPDTLLGIKLRGVIYNYGNRNGKVFSVQKQPMDGGYRVWRTQ